MTRNFFTAPFGEGFAFLFERNYDLMTTCSIYISGKTREKWFIACT